IDPSPAYLLSLGYLAVVGTLAAFLAYLSLVERLGADRAAYVTVLYPVVALAVSSAFEAYRWSAWSITGLALVGLGDIVLFARGLRCRLNPRLLPSSASGAAPTLPEAR